MRGKLALVIAIMLGAVAAYGIYSYMVRVKEAHERDVREVNVVAAAERIRAGTAIRMDMLKPKRLPEVAVDREHIFWRDAHTLVRQELNRHVEREEVIKRTHLREVRMDVGTVLPPGQVAITLRVDDITGVAGTIRPGSHVDVIATMPLAGDARGSAGEVTTWRLLNNCRVIAVDSSTIQAIPTTGRGQGHYNSVTLAVVPEESVLLTYVQNQGRITLALRNETDPVEPDEPPEIRLTNVRSIAERVNRERKRRLREGEGASPARGR